MPPANPGYTVTVDTGITPTTTADRAAAIARHYLDLQTPDLAAPEIHADPIVRSVPSTSCSAPPTLTLAVDGVAPPAGGSTAMTQPVASS